jgi:hypothetical protein
MVQQKTSLTNYRICGVDICGYNFESLTQSDSTCWRGVCTAQSTMREIVKNGSPCKYKLEKINSVYRV